MIAALTHSFHDLELAEDVLQEAFTSALTHWTAQHIPSNPQGWLYQTARRKAVDMLRRRKTHQTKSRDITHFLQQMQIDEEETDWEDLPDERLALIFICCHPALPENAHTALTLKTVCGLTTKQIASAYLISETSMAQRIVRAKRKIKTAGIPFHIPASSLWPERLGSVLSVVYLIFNEGYTNLQSRPRSLELCHEAIRLGKLLTRLLPEEAEVQGLLALMLFAHSRHEARLENPEYFTPLGQQNRKLWQQDMIEDAEKILLKALAKGTPGPYQIQAAINGVHCKARQFTDTDWGEICLLYERLYAYEPTSVVMLNASVALSYWQSPAVGLASLEFIKQGGHLNSYQPYYAARADMLRRAGKIDKARIAFDKAIELSNSKAERTYLRQQLSTLVSDEIR
ncbi:MAG TPA: RNA polymerase sigma factor [Hellea balneolensis]|uniref:RNA polymerase sigma factor n=1 Tax=Hellea balneolensis TaxID=287478 RepID=A0A7C5QT24_9PROT|nr:RNA polymerase sigma factor [Hellea balneolensis]